MNKTRQIALYVITDFLTAIVAWTIFFFVRKQYIDTYTIRFAEASFDMSYVYGVCLIPFMWLFLYYISGAYQNIFRKSRLQECFQTLYITVIGSLIIFFGVLLDDDIYSYFTYYKSISILIGIHFLVTYIPRYIITTITNNRIRSRKIGFNTLLIGSNANAEELYKNLQNRTYSSGNKFVGFVHVFEQNNYVMENYIPHLGSLKDLKLLVKRYKIDEVIIAIESKEHDELENILYQIEGFPVSIHVIPDNYDIISGRVTLTSLYDEPLLLISHRTMPAWQEKMKRLIDIVVSITVLIVASPLYIFAAIGVKRSSPGPIFYRQIRIGRNGKPFRIYKFRSMYTGSEKEGYQLAAENDARVTKFGVMMRKIRLDEIPQFYNVLIGDMSLVGPRPERKHYIELIKEKAPQYTRLLRVRPGITSWGQVKYGYASTVEEMVERLKYDLIYINNMSLYIDLKILIYTVRTVVLRQGV
ncbi:MAG: sugar transferase [Bacteroidales bacterium]|jgi:exopolysaccharide biosynthesis polyprenyl glycosylphosphotransferase|nr:sugar transferase [Bacteroidales bacterium]